MSVEFVKDQPWAITEAGMQTVLSIASRGELYPEALEKARAAYSGAMDNKRPSYRVVKRSALVPIRGTLFRHAGMMASLSGAMSYEDIGKCLEAAVADPEVDRVILAIDSPGGEVTGVAELAGKIRMAHDKKPVVAYAEGICASAAYWLACAAGEIVAARTSLVGSIGVISAVIDVSKAEEQAGVKRIQIVSSGSPGKRSTPVDDDVISRAQARVDDLMGIFVADVARYRGVGESKVLESFGQGDVMIGDKAVLAGMVDRVGVYDDFFRPAQSEVKKERAMESKDLASRMAALRESDPELAAMLDKQQAERESERYEALIAAGKADTGDHARKITSPAQEKAVRAAFQSSAELEKFLRTASAAPPLRPVLPPGSVGDTAAQEPEKWTAKINEIIRSRVATGCRDGAAPQITTAEFARAVAQADRSLPRLREEE